MDMNKICEQEDMLPLQPPLSAVVAIAINGKKKSKYVVSWALENFVPEGKVVFKLIHVRAVLASVPTPMGSSIPISQVRDDVVDAYRKEVDWQTTELLHPYKIMCVRRKVMVDMIVIDSDDIASALAEEITRCNINTLVIGASSPPGMFSRKTEILSSKISEMIPSFCSVYVISRGKLASARPAQMETNGSNRDDNSDTSSISSSSNYSPHSRRASQTLSNVSQAFNSDARMSSAGFRCESISSQEDVGPLNSRKSSFDARHIVKREISSPHLSKTESGMSDSLSLVDSFTEYSSNGSQVNLNFELEKLRLELNHVRGMYAMAQSEKMESSRKLNDLKEWQLEEEAKFKEAKLKEEIANDLARHEKEKYEAAKREIEYVKQCAEREALQRRQAEIRAARDAREKEKIGNALVGHVQQYQKFTWEEIITATSSFSDSLKMGMGAYGTVYKCSLHHTNVAVKVLHSKESSQRSEQFLQELEILSNVRHPHLLLLIGACPDHGCLIYEYMENGNLEERLLQKNGSPPIPWFDRFRIAWEVASALAFLHNAKPKSIIHRDLKPANILLDQNLVSKIGDVGLATILQAEPCMTTMYKDTGPVGTLCYIDPEYQRTGSISAKSDVYAFGIVILQLLTAKPAIAIAHMVERAIEEGSLTAILDSDAGNWPTEETEELAILGLSCAELRRRDRPDLKDKVLPVLEKLKEVAERARTAAGSANTSLPSHFICPIKKDVMNDPCVAADGYTYDRVAIGKWLDENDKSPMTNLPLPNKNLIPNYTLLSAIMEWKSRKQ